MSSGSIGNPSLFLARLKSALQPKSGFEIRTQLSVNSHLHTKITTFTLKLQITHSNHHPTYHDLLITGFWCHFFLLFTFAASVSHSRPPLVCDVDGEAEL
jgi:hypothetical protein